MTHCIAKRSVDLAGPSFCPFRSKEYEELPELSADRVTEGVVRKAGRPVSSNPRKLITIRLPTDVIDRWRASGPGWQRRMADQLSKVR